MPCFCLVTLGKSKLSQGVQRRRGLGDAELCLDGDFGLRVPAMAERDQAGRLRLGEEQISGPGHAAAPPADSPLQYAVLGPSCSESIRRFPQGRFMKLESECTESRFGFAMAELAGALVPLPCSLLVANQTESAKRPQPIWIVRRPKSQRRRRVAQFRRALVDRARTDDVAFF